MKSKFLYGEPSIVEVDKHPVKIYQCFSYLNNRPQEIEWTADCFLKKVTEQYPINWEYKYPFGIAFAFGHPQSVIGMDITTQAIRGEWPGNPLIDYVTFEYIDGVIEEKKDRKGIFCRNCVLILAAELELQDRSKDQEKYLNEWKSKPNIKRFL